jgi:hypothetical protein
VGGVEALAVLHNDWCRPLHDREITVGKRIEDVKRRARNIDGVVLVHDTNFEDALFMVRVSMRVDERAVKCNGESRSVLRAATPPPAGVRPAREGLAATSWQQCVSTEASV